MLLTERGFMLLKEIQKQPDQLLEVRALRDGAKKRGKEDQIKGRPTDLREFPG